MSFWMILEIWTGIYEKSAGMLFLKNINDMIKFQWEMFMVLSTSGLIQTYLNLSFSFIVFHLDHEKVQSSVRHRGPQGK